MPRPVPTGDRRLVSLDARSVKNAQISTALRRTSCPDESNRLLNELAEVNIPIADSIAGRYVSRGIPAEDLRQVARLALVKATRAFRPEPDQDFLAYAVPCIRGELRRHFRDLGWMVRPPRRVQEAQYQILSVRSRLSEKLGREPSAQELADELSLDDKTVVEALTLDGCFFPESLDREVDAEGGWSATIGDGLASGSGEFDHSEARMILAPLLAELAPRDAQVLQLRFVMGMTQREVGEAVGVTQMQVSRIISRVLGQLRARLVPVESEVAVA